MKNIRLKRIIKLTCVCIVLHNLLVAPTYPNEWDHQNEEDAEDNLRDGDGYIIEGFTPRNKNNRMSTQRQDEIL